MNYPQAVIASPLVKATLYLPDAEKGFYRGTRFDWSGIVARLEYKGHTYVGEFGRPHDPARHDHAAGTAEEFSMDDPPGFAEAGEGGAFVKIGVGLLRRGKEEIYKFAAPRAVEKLPPWEIARDPDAITFTQTLEPSGGWGYVYEKKVSLAKDAPILTVAHTLRNTGTKALVTDHYCHNFFIFDDDPIGRNYRIRFPFTPNVERVVGEQAWLEGRSLVFFPEDIPGALWMCFSGFGAADHGCVVENLRTGTSVKLAGDAAPVKWRVYAEKTAVCPEVFVAVHVEPGASQSWTNTYELVAP